MGLRGVNRPDDVLIVQELLNRVPHNLGGPLEKLKVDGYCGRITNSAIEKLQAKQSGWNTVTSIIRPFDRSMQLLLTYDFSDVIDDTPRPVSQPEPVPKVVGSSFLITVAAKPGKILERENYYFIIALGTSKALYFFGSSPPPPLPTPLHWSITKPGYTQTPIPMGSDDWAGEAIMTEQSGSGLPHRTFMYFMPTFLEGRPMIKTELHVHKNEPSSGHGGVRSQSHSRFYLVDSSNQVNAL